MDDESLPSRADQRRADKAREDALARLASELVRLGPKPLARLELPEPVLDALEDARAISSPRARERQLRVVRSMLRDADWPKLRAALDSLLKHGEVKHEVGRDRAREWVVRLVGGGAAALEELLARHPNADRTHLRQLIRGAMQTSEARRRRAEEKLADALASLLERA